MFMADLDNLIRYLGLESFDLLGQSWGGVLITPFLLIQPKGLRKLIITNATISQEIKLRYIANLRQ